MTGAGGIYTIVAPEELGDAWDEGPMKNTRKGKSVADNAEILASLAGIVKEATAGAAQNVTAEKSFADDLDIDSLTMVEIAVLIEERLGVTVPEDELATLTTVGDAVTYIAANSL
jgi:acyl carrier protein